MVGRRDKNAQVVQQRLGDKDDRGRAEEGADENDGVCDGPEGGMDKVVGWWQVW